MRECQGVLCAVGLRREDGLPCSVKGRKASGLNRLDEEWKVKSMWTSPRKDGSVTVHLESESGGTQMIIFVYWSSTQLMLLVLNWIVFAFKIFRNVWAVAFTVTWQCLFLVLCKILGEIYNPQVTGMLRVRCYFKIFHTEA